MKGNSTEKTVRFSVARWVMLGFSLLSNAFIVTYSCLSYVVTRDWNRKFTSIFAKLVNDVTEKEVKKTPLASIELKLSNESSYKYNYIPGYELNEIPLGSAKQIECFFSPVDATNKSITYSVAPEGALILNQNGAILSAVGMKAGECVLTATSGDGGFTSSVNLTIVQPVAPTSFTATLDKNTIRLGETETIKYDIDGGVLTHDELITFRYYDVRMLQYTYDDSIINVDNHGVIHPISEGTTSIDVTNGTSTEHLSVTVEGSIAPPVYTDLKLSGDEICRENEMILDQSSHKNNHQLIIKDGVSELNSEGFIWESSNDLLAKVDRHGVVRGFRKSQIADETVVITATSKITGQSASLSVVVKKQAPTSIYYTVSVGKQSYWLPKEQIVSIGDELNVKLGFNPNGSDKAVIISCDESSVIDFTNEGTSISGQVLKTGNCTLTVTSEANPEASFSIRFIVVKAGAINSDNIDDVGYTIRKSIGHAAVFMVAQIFTFLAFYMFLYNKKWWLYSSISLGEGLFISILSEVIQYFVPTRSGALLDVLIDFSGVVVGFILSLCFCLILKCNKKGGRVMNNKIVYKYFLKHFKDEGFLKFLENRQKQRVINSDVENQFKKLGEGKLWQIKVFDVVENKELKKLIRKIYSLSKNKYSTRCDFVKPKKFSLKPYISVKFDTSSYGGIAEIKFKNDDFIDGVDILYASLDSWRNFIEFTFHFKKDIYKNIDEFANEKLLVNCNFDSFFIRTIKKEEKENYTWMKSLYQNIIDILIVRYVKKLKYRRFTLDPTTMEVVSYPNKFNFNDFIPGFMERAYINKSENYVICGMPLESKIYLLSQNNTIPRVHISRFVMHYGIPFYYHFFGEDELCIAKSLINPSTANVSTINSKIVTFMFKRLNALENEENERAMFYKRFESDNWICHDSESKKETKISTFLIHDFKGFYNKYYLYCKALLEMKNALIAKWLSILAIIVSLIGVLLSIILKK